MTRPLRQHDGADIIGGLELLSGLLDGRKLLAVQSISLVGAVETHIGDAVVDGDDDSI